MTRHSHQRQEALLIEILHAGLDIRAMAAECGSPILAYLSEALIRRAREELDATATATDARQSDLVD